MKKTCHSCESRNLKIVTNLFSDDSVRSRIESGMTFFLKEQSIVAKAMTGKQWCAFQREARGEA